MTKPSPLPLLLKYQQEWILDRSEVKVCEKGRRTGITWATGYESVEIAGAAEGAMDVFYIGTDESLALEFIRAVADWARVLGKAASEVREEVLVDEEKSIKTYVVDFASGFRVQALSSRARRLRGRQGYIIFDEAAFHDAMDDVIESALALLMRGGRIAIISTHNGADSPFNRLIHEIRSGTRPYSLHTFTLDRALADGMYRRICEQQKIEWSAELETEWRAKLVAKYGIGEGADQELFCIPKKSGGSFFPLELLERQMSGGTVLTYTPPKDFLSLTEAQRDRYVTEWCDRELAPHLLRLSKRAEQSFGFDFARSGHLSYFPIIETDRRLRRTMPLALELRNVPFKQQESILFYAVDRFPRFQAGKLDAGGNGQYLAEQARLRYGADRIEEVHLNVAWYETHFPVLKAALESEQLVLVADAELRDDLRSIQVVKGVPKPPEKARRTSAGVERHADGALGVVLAFAASKVDIEVFDFVPVKPRTDFGREEERERSVALTGNFREGW